MATFCTQSTLSHASDNTTSRKYCEDGCMGRPPPHILRGPSPSPPLSLRPWTVVNMARFFFEFTKSARFDRHQDILSHIIRHRA